MRLQLANPDATVAAIAAKHAASTLASHARARRHMVAAASTTCPSVYSLNAQSNDNGSAKISLPGYHTLAVALAANGSPPF